MNVAITGTGMPVTLAGDIGLDATAGGVTIASGVTVSRQDRGAGGRDCLLVGGQATMALTYGQLTYCDVVGHGRILVHHCQCAGTLS